MSSAPIIRAATAADAPAICGLIRALAEYERLTHEVLFDEAQVTEHLFGARPFAEVLLAEENGQVAGFALFFHNFSTFVGRPGIYLEDLFVLSEHRGRGYGKALFQTVARVAVERGCGRMEWTALNWNEPAIEFYRSFGAVPMSEWTTYRLTGEKLAAAAAAPTQFDEIQIRPAAFPDDRATVQDLFREYAASLGIDLAFQQFNEELASLPGKYAPPGGRLLLAYVGAKAAGCAALRPLNDGGCEMKRLYVRPEFRGEGIGRRLVDELIADARDAGHSRIYLDTLPSMGQAIALYESLGFRDTGAYCHNPVAGARFLVLDLQRHSPQQAIPEPVNLRQTFARFSDHWSPKIVGELNGQHVKLVKFQGEFVWHQHDDEDELFLVVKGRFRMEFRDRHVWLNEGEFLIVPRGVEHRPVAEEEVHVLLFEPASTLNTGNVHSDRTIELPERLT
ncbi:MAG TPA: GNAT family N-acetyltransferase [Pirellulales bacterium]|nr:GNAT family N-acetyltransferase [Pirellulales bacterium]